MDGSAGVGAAERDVLTAAKGAGGATAIESALASAIVQQQQAEVGMGQQGPAGFGGGATMELPMLPPAIALAVQNEFKTRFDGSEMQARLRPDPSPEARTRTRARAQTRARARARARARD